MYSSLTTSDFSGRMIEIIVESRYDAELYQLLCGAPEVSGFLFVPPMAYRNGLLQTDKDRGGFRSVNDTLHAKRSTYGSDHLVFGLLDGEESARFGRGNELFERPDLVFSIDDRSAKGLLFLGCFEKENLYLQYGGAVRMMESRQSTGLRPGSSNEKRIPFESAFDGAIRASIIRCAAKSMFAKTYLFNSNDEKNAVEKCVFGAINKNIFGDFRPNRIMADAVSAWGRQDLQDLFVQNINTSCVNLGIDLSMALRPNISNRRLMSICDGYAMLKMVLGTDRDRIYEDMAADLLDQGFGIEFHGALLAAVRGQAVHISPSAREQDFTGRQPLAIRLMGTLPV